MNFRHLLLLPLFAATLQAAPSVTYQVPPGVTEGYPSILPGAGPKLLNVAIALSEPAPVGCLMQFTPRAASKAVAGRDYELPATGHLNITIGPGNVIIFEPGATNALLSLRILQDWVGEPDELLTGAFTGAVNCTIPSPNWDTVIEDDDRCLFAVMKTFTPSQMEVALYDDRFREVLRSSLVGSFGNGATYAQRPSLALGDVKGNDGVPEIIVGSGAGATSRFYVVPLQSFLTSQVQEVIPFGNDDTRGCLVGAGDAGGPDTQEEIIAGTGVGVAVSAAIYSSSNGPAGPGPMERRSVFATSGGIQGTPTGGWASATGDFNNDGMGDLLLANGPQQGRVSEAVAFGSRYPQSTTNPYTYLGIDCQWQPLVTHTNGLYISAGDWNGDGYADIATGLNADTLPGPSYVTVRDCRTQAMLEFFYVTPAADGFMGGAYVAMSPRPHFTADGRFVSSLFCSPITLSRPGIVRYSDASAPLNVPADLLGGPIAAWTPRQDRTLPKATLQLVSRTPQTNGVATWFRYRFRAQHVAPASYWELQQSSDLAAWTFPFIQASLIPGPSGQIVFEYESPIGGDGPKQFWRLRPNQ